MIATDAPERSPSPRRRRSPVVVTGAFVVLAALGACSSKTASSGPSAGTSAGTSQAAVAAADASVTVIPDPSTIGAFSPASITIKAGQTVEWTFQDANPHTVTADDKSYSSKASGLANGAKYRHTYDKAGSFPYHCDIHPQMVAKVIVQ